MNIYFLDTDARLCAQYHNDRHLSRAVLESVQLLAMAHQIGGAGVDLAGMPLLRAEVPAQANHPWALWTRNAVPNYLWMHDLAYWLQRESEARRGPAEHALGQHLRTLATLPLSLAARPTVDGTASGASGPAGPGASVGRYPYSGGTLAEALAEADAGLTAPPQCVPTLYRRLGGPVAAVRAYRQFYFETKQHLALWTPPASKPFWWREAEGPVLHRA